MNLYGAIYGRKSVRSYKKETIKEPLLSQIKAFCRNVIPLTQGIETAVEIIDREKEKTQIKGLWKVDAPYYLVLFSQEKPGYERNAGYMAEQMVLYLTAKGLGSCYLGGSKAAKTLPGMKQVIVVAFGFAEGNPYRDRSKTKRLALKEICVFQEEPKGNVRQILEAARLAPSSFNSQPWRFILSGGQLHVFSCRDRLPIPTLGSYREFNMGIMLSHIMLAAEELWVEIDWNVLEQKKKKAYKNGTYVGTVSFLS
ncbi:MAG: nitroreductase family protein [Lachnospiraceae bacterium]